MKRPSMAFIGTILGLIIVLPAPNTHMHSETDLARWPVFFAGGGAIIGSVIDVFRRRT